MTLTLLPSRKIITQQLILDVLYKVKNTNDLASTGAVSTFLQIYCTIPEGDPFKRQGYNVIDASWFHTTDDNMLMPTKYDTTDFTYVFFQQKNSIAIRIIL